MPTYVYVCSACKREVEFFHSMSEAPKRTCPSCKKRKLVRQLGAGAGILFKGSGFYQTDYRSESYKKAASAEKPSEPAKSEPKAGADSGSASSTPAPAAKPAEKSSANSADRPAKKKD